MPTLYYAQHEIELESGQSVLTALLNQNIPVPHSCEAGACQSCLLQATDGKLPSTAQLGLKDSQKAQGYFLACCCVPESNITVADIDYDALFFEATVTEKTSLSAHVVRLKLTPKKPFKYFAGQFITLWNTDKTIGRSYSLASVPTTDTQLELHIKLIKDGALSTWIHQHVTEGDTLYMQPAKGDCFYIPTSRPLLLAGISTGLAPLIGIIKDALQQQHAAPIHLIHGALEEKDLYLHQTLKALSEKHSSFYYHPSVLRNNDTPIEALALARLKDNNNCKADDWNIYLCGAPDMVNTLKRQLFMAGASMRHIFSDPYLPAGTS